MAHTIQTYFNFTNVNPHSVSGSGGRYVDYFLKARCEVWDEVTVEGFTEEEARIAVTVTNDEYDYFAKAYDSLQTTGKYIVPRVAIQACQGYHEDISVIRRIYARFTPLSFMSVGDAGEYNFNPSEYNSNWSSLWDIPTFASYYDYREKKLMQQNVYSSTTEIGTIGTTSGSSLFIIEWGHDAFYPKYMVDDDERFYYSWLNNGDIVSNLEDGTAAYVLSNYSADVSIDTDGLPYKVFTSYSPGDQEENVEFYLGTGVVQDPTNVSDNDFDDKKESQEATNSDDEGAQDSSDQNAKNKWKDKDKDNLPDNKPKSTKKNSITDCAGAINYYVMTPSQLEAVFDWFWNDLIDILQTDQTLEYMTGLTNNLGANLVSVRLYPYSITGTAETKMFILGRYAATTESLRFAQLDARDNRIFSETVTVIPPKDDRYGNFLDYAPYSQLLIYLPFIGMKELDINMFYNKDITVEYYVDYSNGGLDCYILLGNSTVHHFVGKIGVEVPFSLDSGKDLGNMIQDMITGAAVSTIGSLAGTALSAAGTAAAGAAGGAVGGALGGGVSKVADSMTAGLTNNQTNIYSNNPSNDNVFNEPTLCELIFIMPTYKKNRIGTYGKNVGFAYMKSRKVSELSGFAVLDNPKITYGNTTARVEGSTTTIYPQAAEMDEIYALLESGVYF